MVEKIKDVMSKHISKDNVFDWHVADALGINEGTLASRIKRDSPPLKEIILFCDRCGLDPMKIVMKKKSC